MKNKHNSQYAIKAHHSDYESIKQSHTQVADGTFEPHPDCAVVVSGELQQSSEDEGRTGAASDIVQVKDWVQPF